jgi:hypothetical protein
VIPTSVSAWRVAARGWTRRGIRGRLAESAKRPESGGGGSTHGGETDLAAGDAPEHRHRRCRGLGRAGPDSIPASASVDRCRKKKARKLCKGTFYNCDGQGYFCGTCTNGGLSGAWCFPEIGTLTLYCGTNSYCSDISTCLSTSDCPKANVCVTENGCTGCGTSTGVCLPRCCSGLAGPRPRHSLRRLGRTTAG